MLLKAGWEFQRLGYKSFWGPGRHMPANELTSQSYLFNYTEKWSPRGKH